MSKTAEIRRLVVSTFSLYGFTVEERACAYIVQQLEPLKYGDVQDQWLESIIDHIRNSCTGNTRIVTYELLINALKLFERKSVRGPQFLKVFHQRSSMLYKSLRTADLHQSDSYIRKSLRALVHNLTTEFRVDEDILRVIHAHKLPFYKYDWLAKKFLKMPSGTQSLSMFGDAQSKIAQYVDRYTVIKQRMFRIKTVTDGTLNQLLTMGDKLRDVNYLLSSGTGGKFDRSSKSSSVLLLGILVQLKEGGRYYLEDPTGAIPLDISTTFQKGFFSENCCVLAEGHYCSDQGVFSVTDMALPPCERAEISKIYFGETNNFAHDGDNKSNNLKLLEYEYTKNRLIIFICDVFLDDPKVLKKFHILLNTFNDVVPVAIVMMGNFLSCRVPSHAYARELKSHLTQLGHYLHDTTPALCEHTTFVLLAGSGDRYCGAAGAGILPRPSIPECLTEEFRRLVSRCVFTTNPCRIQYCTQQIHIIRADGLMKKTANYDIRKGLMDRKKYSTVTESDEYVVNNYIKTVESQSHLITLPLDVCPTYWPLVSRSLSLYPMPDLVCIADSNAPEYSTKSPNDLNISSTEITSSSGCVFFNPSSFSRNKFNFSVYITAKHKIEGSQIPEDDEDTNNTLMDSET